MDKLRIKAGPHTFDAHFETAAAPKTCAVFKKLLPYDNKIIHVRWSGEGVWIPLGDLDLGLSLREPHQLSGARASSSSIPAASAKPKSCSPMAACALPARSASSPATISSPSPPISTNSYELGRAVLYEGAKPIRIEAA